MANRAFVLRLTVSDLGMFQVDGQGNLTLAEVLAGLRMYEYQVLSKTMQNPRDPIVGFNPRKAG